MSNVTTDLAGYSKTSPLARLNAKFDELSLKLSNKILACDGTPEGTNASWVTRWAAAMDQLSIWINDKEPVAIPQKQGQSDAGDTLGSKAKMMTADVNNMPELTPALNVEIFVRRMDTVHTSHCVKNVRLEPSFILNVETKMCNEFRTTFQEHCAQAAITTWAQMRTYLLDAHQSTSTVFQELHNATKMRIKDGQQLRDFVARVNTNGHERLTIIKARFKKDNDKEITADALFELMLGQSVLQAMQESPDYQRHYHHIAPDLDQCYTLEKLIKKADRLMEREVNLGTASTSTFFGQQGNVNELTAQVADYQDQLADLQGQMQCLLADQSPDMGRPSVRNQGAAAQNQSPPNKFNNKGRKSFRELLRDPGFVKKMKTKNCRWGLECFNRDVCPCIHPTASTEPSQSQPKVMYAGAEDFRARV